MRFFTIATIVILAQTITVHAQQSSINPSPQPPDTIVWLDYARGVETAKVENKPMLVYFYRESCPYCRKLKSGALIDTTLAEYLNDNFVPIRVNTESRQPVSIDSLTISESQLANEKWLVRGVPCMWLLEPDGCRVKKLVGLKACGNVLADLQEVKAKTYGDCPNLPLAPPRPPAIAPDTTRKTN